LQWRSSVERSAIYEMREDVNIDRHVLAIEMADESV
jgi:hypothetical protein